MARLKAVAELNKAGIPSGVLVAPLMPGINDSPEQVKRILELAEEAGYRAGRLLKLCAFHTSKSVMEETAHLYAAEGLELVTRPSDPTEFIEVRAFPFAEVVRMVERGEIKDGMTIIAVLHVARRRGR